ncbi:peptide-methionine (R)-S-oxide reductase MsrB [Magnetospirillum fulvum]|uniref:peptide-methionine (R)-S-oxide reductase n=1 Tax=Magnetospirillum fulvum MGU-K5 TaxID=1316936 RepID=S9TQ33_MAGFU|nr:methionine-R-sulfoxide reductase [Magnetospirillum fulvum MGU-K5]
MLTRRHLLWAGSSGLALLGLGGGTLLVPARAGEDFPIHHTAKEWRNMLTPEQYAVLREEATERPFSSPLNNEHRAGQFACAGCDQPLFDSTTKYDSGSGWPSFWAPKEGAVATSTDHKIGVARTEVHCSKCGGHLGHVFDDGPAPTGLRYCMNGAALTFTPKTS